MFRPWYQDESSTHGRSQWHEDNVTEWAWDELPQRIVLHRGSAEVPLYPAVVDQGDQVALRLLDDPYRALTTTRRGVATLYRLRFQKAIRAQVKWLPDFDRLALLAAAWLSKPERDGAHSKPMHQASSRDRLAQQVGHLISRIAFVENHPDVRSRDEFENRCVNATERISIASQEIASWLSKLVLLGHQATVDREQLTGKLQYAADDIERQLDWLFHWEFLLNASWKWLQHYPRYLQAIQMRNRST